MKKKAKEEVRQEDPTSSSWLDDAEGLLEMGAKMIDAATVRGLADDYKEIPEYVDDVIDELHQWQNYAADLEEYILLDTGKRPKGRPN